MVPTSNLLPSTPTSTKPNLMVLTEFATVLMLGNDIQQSPVNWGIINQRLKEIKRKQEGFPWSKLSSNEINYLINPYLAIFSAFTSNRTSSPIGLNGSSLELCADFLNFTFNKANKLISSVPISSIVLRFITVLGRLTLPTNPPCEIMPTDDLLLKLIKLLTFLFQYKAKHSEQKEMIESTWLSTLSSILVSIIDKTNSIALCVNSLEFLLDIVDHNMPLETIKLVMPGLLSCASRVLSRNPDTTQRDIFILALSLVNSCFKSTLLLPEFNKSTEHSDKRPSSPWSVNFMKAAKSIMGKIDNLSCHSNFLVRKAYLDLVFWCIKDGETLIEPIRENLLINILPFLSESDSIISSRILKEIKPLLKSIDFILFKIWEQLHSELISIITTGTESDKSLLLQKLVGLQLLLGPRLDEIIYPNLSKYWNIWCKCLTVEPSSLEDLSETKELINNNKLVIQEKHKPLRESGLGKFLYLDYSTTRKLFSSFFRNMGFCSQNISSFVNHGLELLGQDSWNAYYAPSLFIISHFFQFNSINDSDKLFMTVYQHTHNNSIVSTNPSILLDIIPTLVEYMDDFKSNLSNIAYSKSSLESQSISEKDFFRHASICQVLRLLSQAAEFAQLSFRDELFDSLYIVIEKLGHSNSEVVYAASHCLEVMRIACGYSNTFDMVRDNLDYLVHALSQRLHPLYLHPPAASMLIALFRISQGADLYLLDDMFDLVADGLHTAFTTMDSHTVAKFLQVMCSMVNPIVKCRSDREVELTGEHAITDSDNKFSLTSISKDTSEFIKQLREFKSEKESLNALTASHPPLKLEEIISDMLPENKIEYGEQNFDNNDEPPSTSDPNESHLDPIIARCNTRLEKILAATSCYISHSDIICRRIALEIVSEVATSRNSLHHSAIVSTIRRSLDPSWHLLWPGLKLRLEDSDPIVCEKALTSFLAMAQFSFDFLASKLASEILPRILTYHLGPGLDALNSKKEPSACQKKAAILAVYILGFTPTCYLDSVSRFDFIRHLLHSFLPDSKDIAILKDELYTGFCPRKVHPFISALVYSELLPALKSNDNSAKDVAWMIHTYLLGPIKHIE